MSGAVQETCKPSSHFTDGETEARDRKQPGDTLSWGGWLGSYPRMSISAHWCSDTSHSALGRSLARHGGITGPEREGPGDLYFLR